MWHDLSQPLHADIPHPDLHPVSEFEIIAEISDVGFRLQRFSLTTHNGTHIDAPRHFFDDGKTIDETPLEKVSGDGIVLDVRTGEPEAIIPENLGSAKNVVRPDDIVFLYTGWDEKYETTEYTPHPWLSTALVEWFLETGVSLVGTNTPTPDRPVEFRPPGWQEFPVHRELLGNDVLIAENLTGLQQLTGDRVEIVAVPLKIKTGDGA